MPTEYNPLDYTNLTKHCVAELMNRTPVIDNFAHFLKFFDITSLQRPLFFG